MVGSIGMCGSTLEEAAYPYFGAAQQPLIHNVEHKEESCGDSDGEVVAMAEQINTHSFPDGGDVCSWCSVHRSASSGKTCIWRDKEPPKRERVSVFDGVGARRRELFGKDIFELSKEKVE